MARRHPSRWLPVLAAIAAGSFWGPAAFAAPGSAAVGVVAVADRAAFDRTIAAAKAAMLSDPVRARALGATARAGAMTWPLSIDRNIAVATAQWIEGEGAYRANDFLAAGPLTGSALAVVEGIAPGSKLHADLLLSQARLQRAAGKPQIALAESQRAYNFFVSLRDGRGQAKALQSIGSIYQDAQDYERVIYYYRQAEEFPTNESLNLSSNNNMALAYVRLGRRRDARTAYEQSLKIAKKLQSPFLISQILANIGDLEIESSNYRTARNVISAGIQLAAKPAAAGWRPILLGTRAKLAFAEGRLTDAKRDLAAAFIEVDPDSDDQSFGQLHLTAYRVYKAAGDNGRALEHLEAYRRIDERGRTLAASTNAALMTARFDFANQNARIAMLKAGQLSRDVALTKLSARQSSIVLSSLLAVLSFVLVSLFVYLWTMRRARTAVIAANDRLAQSNVELENALLAKSQFLATTSHEIRTPLNGILGMTQVILAAGDVVGGVRDRIMLVDAAGRAMRTLVDDILDFAKMDTGEVRLDAAPVDLTAMMPDLVALWRVQAQDKGLTLRLVFAGVDLPLLTDAARLRQVVSNLLSNAVKFTARGEVTVDVRAESGPGGPAVAIAVTDTGIGVPPAAFETIFEPFRQLDTSTTRHFGGTGLGLAISRHLARVLGGDLTVDAPAAGGTCFTLRLPYPPVAAVERAALPVAAVRILVVSTNPIRRSFLRTALGELGRTAVCETADVASFLALNTAGAVVVDLGDDDGGVPGELLAALGDAAVPVPVVLLVPAALAGYGARWQAAGAARIAVKPLRVEALVTVLRGLLDAAADDTLQPDADPVVMAADVP